MNLLVKHGIFKDLLRACPHHGFSELHQLDTFYNALNSKDQDSLNSAAGGNFLDKMPRECLAIIESKSKVCYLCNKLVFAKVSTNTSTSGISPGVAELKDMVKALLLDKKNQNQAPATMKAVEKSYVTCGDAHSYHNFNYNQGNTSYRPSMMSNQIRLAGFPPFPNNQNVQLNQRNNKNCFNQNQNQNQGNNFNHRPVYQPPVFQPLAYQAPAYQAPAPQTQGVSKEDFSTCVKANDVVMKNMQTQGQNMQNQLTNLTDLLTKFVNTNSASTSSSGTLPSNTIANPRSDLKTITTQSEPVNSPFSEPLISLVSAPRPNQRPSIPYPSRFQDQKLRDKANDQLCLSIKSLLINKDKLCELTRTSLNEHCLADLLKNLPEKLGDPGKFLIPYDFSGKTECLSLADLGASINLVPLSMWNKLSLPDLTPTCMTLKLADRSISRLVGIAEDVYIGRALIDVFECELTFRVGKEAITFNLDQTSRYSANYSDMTAKRIDVIDMACEEYSQEVLGFSDVILSGNPTPYYDLIIYTTSLTLTPFENSDFLLEEVDAILALKDYPTSPKVDHSYLDPEGDILLLEAFLNDDPSLPPPNQGNYLPEVELKDLPPHLEYAFLEGDDKLPVIIAKDLSMEEKTALITVLKSHNYFQIFINPKDQEKTTFTCPYKTFAYRRMPFGLCNAPGTFQRCMMAIFHDMIEKTIEVFMDDFSVFGNCFQSCLSHLERMLKRCEDTNLCLNWEKSHFMVKEGIVLGHKISKQGIKVDKSKVDVITRLPHPTTVKEKQTKAPILIAPDWDMPFELMCDASDFAIGAVLGQHQDKHFRPIHYASKTMTEAQSNYTTTEKEMLAVVYAFKKF
uniref:Retrovirus-related Pol polyprotein from transposon 17.6 n=1 Tax=Tanacetum cinerariifolium TaxID=118510 RepID=A0A699J841_TANCI|nr:retrovirus-related Pol polyprotein from transposon 17.6 [Tanacetum cinerariifolium]